MEYHNYILHYTGSASCREFLKLVENTDIASKLGCKSESFTDVYQQLRSVAEKRKLSGKRGTSSKLKKVLEDEKDDKVGSLPSKISDPQLSAGNVSETKDQKSSGKTVKKNGIKGGQNSKKSESTCKRGKQPAALEKRNLISDLKLKEINAFAGLTENSNDISKKCSPEKNTSLFQLSPKRTPRKNYDSSPSPKNTPRKNNIASQHSSPCFTTSQRSIQTSKVTLTPTKDDAASPRTPAKKNTNQLKRTHSRTDITVIPEKTPRKSTQTSTNTASQEDNIQDVPNAVKYGMLSLLNSELGDTELSSFEVNFNLIFLTFYNLAIHVYYRRLIRMLCLSVKEIQSYVYIYN